MSSTALAMWRSSGLARLAELEAVHANLTGTGPGRRWGTTQLNRSLFLALVAQFQSYCRDLHDDAVAVYVAEANPYQRDNVKALLVQGRRLDTHNPRRATLGHDFVRLGIPFTASLKATGAATERQLDALERVVDYRNAIGHGDEGKIAVFESGGEIKATKKSYQQHRRAIDALASTMDDVIAQQLASSLGIPEPW